MTFPVCNPTAVPTPDDESWQRPRFLQPISYDTPSFTTSSFPVVDNRFSSSLNWLQESLATSSTAFPLSLSRFLKLLEEIDGTPSVVRNPEVCVCPNPQCSAPSPARELASKVGGPLFPVRWCSAGRTMLINSHCVHLTFSTGHTPSGRTLKLLRKSRGPCLQFTHSLKAVVSISKLTT